jgi:hypothetical protein
MFCVDVAVLIILDRSFPFVLMVRGVLRKDIVDSGSKNSEKFGNNNTGSSAAKHSMHAYR